MEYFKLGDIQEEIISHYHKYHQGLGFKDAVLRLRNQKKMYDGSPVYPDFLSWDTSDLTALKPLVANVPVTLEEVLNYRTTHQPQVQINLEFYTPATFKKLEYITLIYVVSGSAIFYTQTESHSLDTGSLFILPPDFPHRLFCTSSDIVISIISTADLFKEHFSLILKKSQLLSTFFYQNLHNRKDFLHFILTPDSEVLHLIKHLFAEFSSTDTFSTEVFLNYLQILYAQILRSCNKSYTYKNLSHRSQITILPSILLYIQKNYKTISLSELATHFNYAPAYISRLIKKETDKNFIEIISEQKIKEAKQLLLFTQYNMRRIANIIGYNSADHFTYSFKKITGYTPRDYRKHRSDKA